MISKNLKTNKERLRMELDDRNRNSIIIIFKCKIVKAKIEKEPDSKYGFRSVKVLDDYKSK